MGSLSKADQKQAMNQSIYTLSSFLRLADSHNKLVIFDLYRPPEKHPYRNLWLRKVLDVILKEAKIKRHLVGWPHSISLFLALLIGTLRHTLQDFTCIKFALISRDLKAVIWMYYIPNISSSESSQ